MASFSISISICLVLVVAWSTTFAFPYYYAFAAASESSALLQLEAEAMRKSSWWSDYAHNTSSHCTWDSIECDKAGSVIGIFLPYRYQLGDKFVKFNFSCFPNLLSLDLSGNGFNGSIPPAIGNVRKLVSLYLGNNTLSGPIPSSLSQLTNLKHLYLHLNQINGSIPPEIGALKNLAELYLSGNNLTGPIPSSLSQLTNLRYLYLDSNQINGFIPLGIGNLTNLIYLQISRNKLSGPIPTDFSKCHNMQFLFLNNNNLSGSISHQIGYPSSLHAIDLSHNLISGEIPPRLGRLMKLQYLYLSHNNLSGTIPTFFNFPSQIDFSYNALEGQITDDMLFKYSPEAFIGNEGLCRDFEGLTSCSPTPAIVGSMKNDNARNKVVHYIAIFLPIGIFIAILIFGLLFLSRQKGKNTQIEASATKNGNMFSLWNYDGKIAYEDIIQATEDFDIKYCIGTGGYGSVYKAQLPCGNIVALKKLHRFETENPTFDKSFRNEVQVLTNI